MSPKRGIRRVAESLALSFCLGVVCLSSFAGEDRRVKLAHNIMDFQLYEEAIALFGQVLKDKPGSPNLRIWQAYAYYRLNKSQKAIEALKRELEIHPADLGALVLLCHVQYASGLEEEAEISARAFQKACETASLRGSRDERLDMMGVLSVNAGIPYYILGLRAKKRLDARAARFWFIEARDLGYDPADCWIQAIDLEMEAKNWAEALLLCETGGEIPVREEIKPRLSAALRPLAKASSGGIKLTDRILADVLTLKALIFAQQGKNEDARDCLESVVAKQPFREEALKNLAGDCLRRGDFEKAARLLARAERLDALDFQARFLLEQARSRRLPAGASEGIVLSKDFMKTKEPRFIYIFSADLNDIADKVNQNALKLIQGGLLINAANTLQKFTEICENSPTIYYNLGQLYNVLDRPAEALRNGWMAVELKNDYRDAYDLIGISCYKLGDLENSVRFYKQAVWLDPKDPMAHFNLGRALGEWGDVPNAETNLLEAVRLENATKGSGSTIESTPDELKHSLAVNVELISAPACESLGYLYAERGEMEKAFEYFKKATVFNADAPVPYLELGKLCLERQKPEEAAGYFKKYLSLGGDEGKVKALLEK